MIRLIVRAIGTDSTSNQTTELVKIEANQYNPERLLRECAEMLVSGKPQKEMGFSNPGVIQINIEYFAEGPDTERPSFHFDVNLLQLLVDAKAEIDFDPYVYLE